MRRGLRVDAWHVDRVADFAVEQGGADRLRDFDADIFLRLRRAGAEVRGEDDVSRSRSGEICGRRLHLEDVERRGGDVAVRERCAESRFVDQAAAGAVDDAHALLAEREAAVIEHVLRLRGERHVHGDEVAAGRSSSSFSTSSTWRLRALLAERYGS